MKTRLTIFISLMILLAYPAVFAFAQGTYQAVYIRYGDSVQGASDLENPALYIFDGKTGDKVSIRVVATDLSYQPMLALFTREGDEVASTMTGLIEGQILAQDGLYLILIGSQSSAGHFTLTLKNAGSTSGGSGGVSGLGDQGGSQTSTGRIAFSSNQSGEWEIYTVNPDGSDLRQLTSVGGSKFTPMWSPDGLQIAYRFFDGTRWVIYGMRADGSNPHAISQGNTSDFSAAWSPDGQQLVVGSGSDWNACDIYVMNADGSNRRLVIDTQQTANSPVWWPDGEQILFNRIENGVTSIYAVSPDGSGLSMLVENARDVSVSPDGESLAICSNRGGNWNIYLQQNGQLYQVTDTSEEEARPMWSPDGHQLAFMQSGDGGTTWQIMVINLDDAQIVRLTNNTANNVDEHWSPR